MPRHGSGRRRCRRTRATSAARHSTSTRCTATGRSPINDSTTPPTGSSSASNPRPVRGSPEDRDTGGIVADPRNDENVIISGLQCAFLLFHNNAVDAVRAPGVSDPADALAEARRLDDVALPVDRPPRVPPHVVGEKFAHEALFGDSISRRWFNPGRNEAFMPVEFQTGTYRMGHSMVRPSYRANLAGDDGDPFFALVFDTDQEGKPIPTTCAEGVGRRAGSSAGRRSSTSATARSSRTRRSTRRSRHPCSRCPSARSPATTCRLRCRSATSCGTSRGNCRRAKPSLRHSASTPSSADLDELSALNVGLEHSTPLWYYVLKEAELLAEGHHLGPVGGRITAQVLVGLLRSDPASFLTVDPAWQPTLPYAGQSFAMTDFLTFAGVDPQTRGQ